MSDLRIEDLTFQYPSSDKPALDHVDLALKSGDICVLTGATGSGKTTLLRCIKRELAPPGNISGSIEFGGRELIRDRFAPNVAMVVSDPDGQLVCDGVIAELAFGLENAGFSQGAMSRRIAEISAYFGLSHLLDRKTHELSSGEKQMLALASAVITGPDLLLLDEPTSHLDARSTKLLAAIIGDLNQDAGTTVIIATHSPKAFSRYATAHASISDGHLRFGMPMGDDAKGGAEDCTTAKAEMKKEGDKHDESKLANGREAAFCIEDASFRFDGGPDILQHVYLNVKTGTILSVLGANGSGKTTLLKLIAGIHEPQHGKVTRPLKDSQAYMPQDVRLLFSRNTVADELSVHMHGKEDICKEASDIAVMIGLEGDLDKDPYDLSDGQRQLLGIAKIFLSSPSIAILDEPTKNLDPKSTDAAKWMLRKMSNSGTTIILSTHDVALAASISDACTMMFDSILTDPVDPIGFFGDSLFMGDAIR